MWFVSFFRYCCYFFSYLVRSFFNLSIFISSVLSLFSYLVLSQCSYVVLYFAMSLFLYFFSLYVFISLLS